MQPPKCPSCGKAEWGHLCGGGRLTIRASNRGVEVISPGRKPVIVARKPKPKAAPDSGTPVAADAPKPNPIAGGAVAAIEPRQRAPKGSFDRKTYQRDLMRARRAKQKEPTP